MFVHRLKVTQGYDRKALSTDQKGKVLPETFPDWHSNLSPLLHLDGPGSSLLLLQLALTETDYSGRPKRFII